MLNALNIQVLRLIRIAIGLLGIGKTRQGKRPAPNLRKKRAIDQSMNILILRKTISSKMVAGKDALESTLAAA